MAPTGGDPLEPLSAAVLAGGASRRMGTDKALLRLAPGIPPLAALVIRRLRLVADDVVLVASPRPEYREFGVPALPDLLPGHGPLGGIFTALKNAQHSHCLVTGCDMPFLNPVLLAWMASQPRDYDLLLPCVERDSGVQYHPLHAIYAKSCLPVIERRLERSQLDLHGLAHELKTRVVGDAEIEPLNPTFDSFVNVNTPDDLAWARHHLRP